ncbi:MAG: type II toxin-antitoxin system RelE/ParE family toxin [Candidatus Dormibacteraeota bacterium]|nr:type II toxin-antitoxin system RelE/ParE family toxin [Candidatus Dormibacteraeota bacterium]
MAEVRWTRNPRGFYLELTQTHRDLLAKQIGHLERFPQLGQRDRSGSDRRLLRVRRFGVLYDYLADDDLVIVISIRPLTQR